MRYGWYEITTFSLALESEMTYCTIEFNCGVLRFFKNLGGVILQSVM